MLDDERDINRHLQMRRKPIKLRTNRADSCGFMVGLMIVFGLFGVIWWPVYLAARPKAQGAMCLSHIKQLSQAMSLYAQDWDECRPSAEHWGDALPEYLRNTSDVATLFHCPAATSSYSYAFNRCLGNLKLKQIAVPEETVQLFEADVSSINAAGDKSLLPLTPRHLGDGSNIGFADGHAKWELRADWLRWQP